MNFDDLERLAGCGIDPAARAALQVYADLVTRWTQRINLVSRSTVDTLWSRHIADSAQLYPLVPPGARRFADLGSGGGFPGIVLAILARQHRPDARFTLVESDQRKATFLREAVRVTGVAAEILCDRAEHVAPLAADVVSARALSALPELLGLVHRHLAPDGVALLPKGAGSQAEVDAARLAWAFDVEEFPSQTSPDARLLRLQHLSRRTGSSTST